MYDPDVGPDCWCVTANNCYVNHDFSSVQNTKKMVRNFIHDGWAVTLQPALATWGYIHKTSKLDTEKKNLCDPALGANLLNLSFDPDPHMVTPCLFPTIGNNVVTTPL